MKILDELTNREMFFLLAGPCVIEGEEMALNIAGHITAITQRLGIPYVFKGSFKKANRSRLDSFTGIGDEKALEILAKVKKEFHVPVVTDIHTPEDAVLAAEYVDVLQIPAFLCRQTDLLVAAARTGKIVNIKKGQFLAPESMAYAVEKWDSDGTGDNIRLSGFDCGLSWGEDHAGVLPLSCSGGCDAFFTAAEPGLWGVRGTSSVDRDNCTRRGGSRSRWYFH